MRHLLKESLDIDYIKQIEDDIRTFLKNVNRLKRYEDFWELRTYWDYWKENELDIFEKKVSGKGTGAYDKIQKDMIVGKIIIRLASSLDSLFTISELNLKNYAKKQGDITVSNEQSVIIKDLIENIEDWNGKVERIETIYGNPKFYYASLQKTYFEIWQSNANSRYISTKKIVDESFEELADLNISDHYVKDTTNYKGIKINLIYEEYQAELVYMLYKSLETALDILDKNRLLPYISNTIFSIDLVDASKHKSEYKDTMSIEVAGIYVSNRGTKNTEIVLYEQTKVDMIIVVALHEAGHSYYYSALNKTQKLEFLDFYKELTYGESTKVESRHLSMLDDFINDLYSLKKEYKNFIRGIQEDDYIQEIPEHPIFVGKYISNKSSLDFSHLHLRMSDYLKDNYRELYDIYYAGSDYGNVAYEITKRYDLLKGNQKLSVSSNQQVEFISLNQFSFLIEAYSDVLYPIVKGEKKIQNFEPLPSDYAGTNDHELFAELFSAYYSYNLGLPSYYFRDIDRGIIDVFKGIAGLREKYKGKKRITIKEKKYNVRQNRGNIR